MSSTKKPAQSNSKRDELLELSRAILLTAISAGMVPGSPNAAREFVRMARAIVSEVETPTVAPVAKTTRIPVDGDGDDDGGADLGGLEELGV